jgi:DeoR family transcriptional regulator, fructose operon transcriptional repressor
MTMFGLERLQAIRELILEKKSVEVAYLSQSLDVSEVTIRRDLDKLEKEGLIVKTYGGAILLEEGVNQLMNEGGGPSNSLLLNEKTDPNGLEIAKTASKLIMPNDTVFISGGDQGEALALQVAQLPPLIIVTNNIKIAMYLFQETGHKIIILGGSIDPITGSVIDYDQLEELLIEKAFFSVEGVDLDVGYTVNEKSDVMLFKALKRVSRHLIVMTNSQLYDKRGLVKLTSLSDIGTVVTDKHIPDTYKSYYYEQNVTVHTSMLT